MTPQIIFIIIILANLVLSGYHHGKERKGRHNLFVDLIGLGIIIILLTLGGFFDPLFK
jgi:hypothetical protein